jgi:hypothetical protein
MSLKIGPTIQPVLELPPQDSKMTKIYFPVVHIKFSISAIPEACPVLQKNRRGC